MKRPNKSLDASGGGAFRIVTGPRCLIEIARRVNPAAKLLTALPNSDIYHHAQVAKWVVLGLPILSQDP